jgi:hypothetical protein
VGAVGLLVGPFAGSGDRGGGGTGLFDGVVSRRRRAQPVVAGSVLSF